MKVETKKAAFTPVVITLESQHEVDFLKALMNAIGGAGKYRNISSDMTELLSEYSKADYEDVFKEGSVYVKEI